MKNTKTSARVVVIRGGRLPDAAAAPRRRCGHPGRGRLDPAPSGRLDEGAAGANRHRRARMLLHPGLVNAHMHGHGNLGRDGDR
jgi:hypothetical protein